MEEHFVCTFIVTLTQSSLEDLTVIHTAFSALLVAQYAINSQLSHDCVLFG